MEQRGEETENQIYVPPVDSIQVCAKAENLFQSIRKSRAEAERLGCTPLLLLKGALITVIAPCVDYGALTFQH